MRTTMSNKITTLVGELEDREAARESLGNVAAPNGSVYGIPFNARRVSKFNPVNKSMTHIGPDFGGERVWCKWYNGAINDRGTIYCIPQDGDRGILKIDTNTDDVTELNVNLLPEQGSFKWLSCAAALDGCIYFMPLFGRRIMKLDPNNNDAMSSVGDDQGYGYKYIGTVVGIDGCVYGIPQGSKRILKYDPINDITSFVGEEADKYFGCNGNGVLGRDGCIYALARGGRVVLKIDTVINSHGFVGNSVDFDDDEDREGWGDAILGIDGCVYWPPFYATRALKYDPHTDLTSPIGDYFGGDEEKWFGGALTTDGVIYCIPTRTNWVVAIDPLGEFSVVTKANVQEHPENFGLLFQTMEQERPESFGLLFQTIEADEDSDVEDSDDESALSEDFGSLSQTIEANEDSVYTSDDNENDEDYESVLSEELGSTFQNIEGDVDSVLPSTNFDLAVVKFGQNKVFEVLEKAMKPINDYCRKSNLCPFMIVASHKEIPVCAINHLLRRDLSWVNSCIGGFEGIATKNNK